MDLIDRQDGDTISRQAAIDLLDNLIGMVDDNHGSDYDAALRMGIEALKAEEPEPSEVARDIATIIENEKDMRAIAQPRKGKWIYGEDDCQDGWFCSECRFFIPWDYDYYGLNNINFIKEFHACPHCKAEMVTYTGKKEDMDEHSG